MTPTVFYAACLSLWGTSWRDQAVAKLPVSERTLRRWINGDEPVPLGVWANLQTALSAKQGEIAAIRHAIKLPSDPPACICTIECLGLITAGQRCQELPPVSTVKV